MNMALLPIMMIFQMKLLECPLICLDLSFLFYDVATHSFSLFFFYFDLYVLRVKQGWWRDKVKFSPSERSCQTTQQIPSSHLILFLQHLHFSEFPFNSLINFSMDHLLSQNVSSKKALFTKMSFVLRIVPGTELTPSKHVWNK